ncbi:MAG: hypothetical protein PHS79_04750 [Patescibacteria group bacterium]|nr:hypothetical protein [Patescibacteria group bacterium]
MKKNIEIVRECRINPCVGVSVNDLLCLLDPRIDLTALFDHALPDDDHDIKVASHPGIMLVARTLAQMSTPEVYAALRAESLRPVPPLGLIIFAVQHPVLAEEMMPIAMGEKAIPVSWGILSSPDDHGLRREIARHRCRSYFAFKPCSIDPSAMAIDLAPERDGWPEGTHLLVAPRNATRENRHL